MLDHWRGLGALDLRDEQAGGTPTKRCAWQSDRGQARPNETADEVVIEADDGHIAGDVTATGAQGVERSDGDEVVGGGERGERRAVVEQVGNHGKAGLLMPTGDPDERRVERDTEPGHSGAEAASAGASDGVVLRALD